VCGEGFKRADVVAGGRGKSTLAKVMFNKLAGGFSYSAFVEAQAADSPNDRAQLLDATLQQLGATAKAAHGAAGLLADLKACVRGKRVLFVLDNVWTGPQLDALLPTEWGKGSVVIVTSRSKGFTDSDAWSQV
jgi:hypothetical protein